MGRPKKKLEENKASIETKEEINQEEQKSEERLEVIDNIQKLNQPSKEEESDLKKLLKDVEKTFGEGVIVSAEEILEVAKVSTRNLLLDILTNGGLPKGSISLFCGEESSGKTLQALMFASVFTTQNIPVLYIGTEGDIDKNWAIKLGNNPKYFYVSRPGDLETAINVADVSVRSRKFGLVIFDSITASPPKESLDKDAFAQQMALQARLNAKLCQKITSGLQPSNLKDPNAYNSTHVVLIAHLREKVGVVYGNPETIPGGHAVRHHSSYIFKFKKGQVLKKNDIAIGREMRITVEKAKFSRPLISGITELYFDPPRLNNAKVMLTYAVQLGLIKQAGAFFTYKDIKAQGQKALLEEFKKQEGLLEEVKVQVINSFNK
jgi:protein RecA